MKDIILVGAFHEVIELANECNLNIIGIIDNNIKKRYFNIQILGSDREAEEIYLKYSKVPLVISPDVPQVRERLFKFYSTIGFKFQNLISPKADISKSASLGNGILVQQNVNITSNVIIKDGVRLNVCACVMHDSIINAFTTLAPCSVILGRVNIGKRVYIGANATILPLISIGEDSIIGAGSVVIRDVEPNITVVGVPAKPIFRE